MTNNSYIEHLSKMLKAYFDIEYHRKIGDFHFDLFARYNSKNSRFFLSRKVEIYSFETNEYILYKDLNQPVNYNFLESLKEFLDRNIEKIVHIKDGHMSSILTFIFTGDFIIDKKIAKSIRKFNYYKSFKLGFNGWVNVRIYFINPNEGIVYSNRYGRRDKKRFLLNNTLKSSVIQY